MKYEHKNLNGIFPKTAQRILFLVLAAAVFAAVVYTKGSELNKDFLPIQGETTPIYGGTADITEPDETATGTSEIPSSDISDVNTSETNTDVDNIASGENAEETDVVTNDTEDSGNTEEENAAVSDTTGSETPEAKTVILDVPYINQLANYPNGCESVSAVMAMQYFGNEITPYDFIEDYLEMGRTPYISGIWRGPDPREKFPGDPRKTSGWGCYPEVIKNAVDKMAPEGLEAVVLKDVPLSTLCSEYIDNGIPVLLWATINMYKPETHVTWVIDGEDRTHTWINPFHCLLLVGYDEDNFYFNDPMRYKGISYSEDAVQTAYCGVGMEALVIVPGQTLAGEDM